MQLVPIEIDRPVAIVAEDRSNSVSGVLEQTIELYGRRGFDPPWTGYLAEEQGTWVGTCGFAGPPSNGEVEIAYFTFPGQEGHGVATRMVTALLARTGQAATRSGLDFIAHTLPRESASTSILRRLRFTLLGAIVHPEDGTVWKWHKSASGGDACASQRTDIASRGAAP
jgi:ribosomal-protein-alanine N-acetyltransferase